MPKVKLTKEYIKKAKAAKKSTAKLHPDEMILGGDSKYINDKYKQFGKKKPAEKKASKVSKATIFPI